MRPRIFLLAVVLFFSLLIIGSTDVSAQSSIQDLIITQVGVSDFPQVMLRFRALDADGLPVSNAQLSIFNVLENGLEAAPENLTKAEEGIWVHFVVDAGVWLVGDRWTNARTSIIDFVQTTPWMKENLDHVALTVVPASGAQNLVSFTGNGRDLLPALENFTPPRGDQYSAPIQAMDEILDQMALLPEAENQPKFIVFLSAGLESGAGDPAAMLAEKAREQQIPIYVIGLREDQKQPLQELAEESNGRFALYNRLTDINPLYTQLVAYREQYDLSYRSAVSQSGTQEVELIANVSTSGHVSALSSYDIEVNPPRVLIQSPKGGDTITRKAEEYTEDRAAIVPTTASVVANVIFPDDHLRRLQQAVLLVNGVVANTLNRPNPTSDLEFVWDLRNVEKDGTNDFSLEVEITDELGLTSRSPAVSAKVEVIVPAQSVNPVATVDIDAIRDQVTNEVRTEIESSLPVTVITCFDFSPEWICSNIERPLRRNWVSFLAITISVVFSGVVWVNKDKGPIKGARETVMRGVDRLTKRYLGPSEAKAYLVVLEGDVNIGKALEIFGDTPVGRSKQNAELLFQQHDETSPLSRLHCTIVDEEDHFLIRDEDSANGTFLNGRKLIPLQTEELHEGDEIELARVERGGVRLLFQLAKPNEWGGGDVTDSFRVTKQTRPASNGKIDADETIIEDGDRF